MASDESLIKQLKALNEKNKASLKAVQATPLAKQVATKSAVSASSADAAAKAAQAKANAAALAQKKKDKDEANARAEEDLQKAKEAARLAGVARDKKESDAAEIARKKKDKDAADAAAEADRVAAKEAARLAGVEAANKAAKDAAAAAAAEAAAKAAWLAAHPNGNGDGTDGTGDGTGDGKKSVVLGDNPAYKILLGQLQGYGIANLAGDLAKIREDYPELSSSDALELLKYDPRYNKNYNTRFSANATRMKNGLPQLDPATYLQMENGYKAVLTAYGATNLIDQSRFNDLIGADKSVSDVSNIVAKTHDRLMADPNTLAAFQQHFPALAKGDILAGMLDPKASLPALQQKVASAEIGGQALFQGLKTDANDTTSSLGTDQLAALGITKSQAAGAYQQVAAELPTADKLTAISGNTLDAFGQKQAEQESLLGLASATRARQAQAGAESARFNESTGTGRATYAKDVAGQI